MPQPFSAPAVLAVLVDFPIDLGVLLLVLLGLGPANLWPRSSFRSQCSS
jgi:hypothetical protein